MTTDEIRELFAGLGPVTIRRLFGGKGIYHDDAMFALVTSGGDLYLKADQITASHFVAAGTTQFIYERGEARTAALPYWRPPIDAFDDPDEMMRWARLAVEASQRAAAKRKPPRRRSSPP